MIVKTVTFSAVQGEWPLPSFKTSLIICDTLLFRVLNFLSQIPPATIGVYSTRDIFSAAALP